MLVPAQAALLRGAHDLPPIQGVSPAAALRRDAAAEAGSRAVLPALGEGQLEPQPGTMSFRDFLSGLNPLQHLPLVGTIYRAVTGDVPPTVMRVAGGFLLGGPLGAIASAVGAAAEEVFASVSLRGEPDGSAPSPAPPAAQPSAPPASPPAGDAPAAALALAVPSLGSSHAPNPAAVPAAAPPPSGLDEAERLSRLRRASEAYARQIEGTLPIANPALAMAQTAPAGLTGGLTGISRGLR